MKQCSICKENKPFDEFYSYEKESKSRGKYTYYYPYCKICSVEKTTKNRDYDRNRELVKHYYRTRPRTRELRKAVMDKRRAEGKFREWQQKNPDKIRQYNRQRMDHKKHEISDKEWIACKEYFNNSCAYCGFEDKTHKEIFKQQLHKEHVDHEGANDLSNCVPACRSCNASKYTFDINEWYNEDNPNFTNERLTRIINWLDVDYKFHLEKVIIK